jgi:uncharacterized NAD-dependent epimerase/dehydratase family protein
MSSSMFNIPEPLHLYAQHLGTDVVRVVNGDGSIVAQATPVDFVAAAVRELKLRGHDHETQVIIYGVSSNPAWNGAIKHHP